MLFKRLVTFFGTRYQKHWKTPKQLDISEISLNKNLFKIMINIDFWACACLVLNDVSLFCLFPFLNLVCLRVGYLQPLLASQPTPTQGFLCFMLFDVMFFYGNK